MAKIVVLDGSAVMQKDKTFDFLKEYGELICYEHTPKELIKDRIKGAEIILTNKVIIDKEVIDFSPSLKFVSVLATGYNVVDCSYARQKNIIVSNVPAYSSDSVAQHTFALILELCAQSGLHSRAVYNNEWCKAEDFCLCLTPIIELKNKVIGIIGYGSIGKAVAKIAEAFGMKVLIHNRTPFECCVSLEELFSNSDIITLHCPLTDSNKKMINKEAIALMKKSAIIINTARGGLIDEDALADALNNNLIGGFGADVLSEEPPKESNKLLKAKNTVITPHIAWASSEARGRLLDITAQNIKKFLDGEPINVVN